MSAAHTVPSYAIARNADTAIPPVIVGAGPAGTRAAATLVRHGLRPVVLDESPRSGGQIYRRTPQGFSRSSKELYGTEAARADAVHAAFDAMLAAGSIDYRPNTLVWNAQPDVLDLLAQHTRKVSAMPWHDVIVATGATDRVLPIPGWTLPGVYTLGGAQVALKYQGCAIGSQVVLAGTGPLLYLVAYQYVKAGANVVAVLDTAPANARMTALKAMWTMPSVLLKGVQLTACLKLRGIPVHHGVTLEQVHGDTSVQAIQWRDSRGHTQRTACTAVGLGYALRPETQLADLLGCSFEFSALHRCHVPVLDDARRSSVPGVYLAGDGAGIMGADAAELSGELAALALLQDRGLAVSSSRIATLQAQLAKVQGFREGLEQAFPFPENWAAQAPDALVVCRCENVTAGEMRNTAKACDAKEINRLKALCRVGMGRCQGRMCGAAAVEVLAHAQGIPVAQAGRIRAQAPIKPLPVDVQLEEGDHV